MPERSMLPEPIVMPSTATSTTGDRPGPHRVQVVTGSRLHFGMFSFGRSDVRQFGGLGLMVEQPGLQLELALQPGNATSADDGCNLAARARGFIRRLAEPLGLGPEMAAAVRVRVLQAPAQHTGLGVGTQLALAVGRGLQALLNRAATPIALLARWLDRGRRSAVGIYGFELGGLIVESGKCDGQSISPLAARVELPEAWRFVLLTPGGAAGLSGEAEMAAFGRLPAVPLELTSQLCQQVLLEIVPAAREGDARAFGVAIDRFGRMAGECFAAQQGGVYASPAVEQLAAAARDEGALGVAQSSWGPTLAALVADDQAARELVCRLQRRRPWGEHGGDVSAVIAAPRNRPAQVIAPGHDGPGHDRPGSADA